MACINIKRLVILSRRKTSFYAIFYCFLLFHGYNTISKRFNEEIILHYTVQEEDMQYFTQVHCSRYFTWFWAAV